MSTRVDSVEGWEIVKRSHDDFEGPDVWTVLSVVGLIGLVAVAVWAVWPL